MKTSITPENRIKNIRITKNRKRIRSKDKIMFNPVQEFGLGV
jgi:hypothetical protein